MLAAGLGSFYVRVLLSVDGIFHCVVYRYGNVRLFECSVSFVRYLVSCASTTVYMMRLLLNRNSMGLVMHEKISHDEDVWAACYLDAAVVIECFA